MAIKNNLLMVILVLLLVIPITIGITLEEFDISGYNTLDYSDKNVFHVHIYDPNATITTVQEKITGDYNSYTETKQPIYITGKKVTYLETLHYKDLFDSEKWVGFCWNNKVLVHYYGDTSVGLRYIIYDFEGNTIKSSYISTGTSPYHFYVIAVINYADRIVNIIIRDHNWNLKENITINIPDSFDINQYDFYVELGVWNKYNSPYAYVKYNYEVLTPNSVIANGEMYISNMQFLEINDTTIEIYDGENFSYIYNEKLYDVELYYVDTGYNLTLKTDKNNYDYFLAFPQGGFYANINTTNTTHVVIEYSIPETKPTENIIMSGQLDYLIALLFVGVVLLFAFLLHEKSVLPFVWIVGLCIYNIIPYWIGIVIVIGLLAYIIYKR